MFKILWEASIQFGMLTGSWVKIGKEENIANRVMRKEEEIKKSAKTRKQRNKSIQFRFFSSSFHFLPSFFIWIVMSFWWIGISETVLYSAVIRYLVDRLFYANRENKIVYFKEIKNNCQVLIRPFFPFPSFNPWVCITNSKSMENIFVKLQML